MTRSTPHSGAARLFHTIVVVAAAASVGAFLAGGLVGCSGSGTDGEGASGTGSAGQGGMSASSGQGGGLFEDPIKPEDCAYTQQYFCDASQMSCYCDEDAPLTPSDCEKTVDFHCEEWGPPQLSCVCIPDSPESPADCGMEPDGFQCESYEPPYGCDCQGPVIV